MEKKAYSIPEFLAAHSLSRSALYRLWHEGDGPVTVRVGRKVLIPVGAAEEWLKSLQAEAA
jgi:predicted DNA-binding transcriptional regulator AlpA